MNQLPTSPEVMADEIRGMRRFMSICLLVLTMLTLVAWAVCGFFIVPSYRKVFDDMGAGLPTATRAILSFPVWAYLGWTGLLATFLVAKELFLKSKIAMAINGVTFIVMAVVAFVFWLAMQLPMSSLMQSIQR